MDRRLGYTSEPGQAQPVRQPVAVATPLKPGRASQPDPDLAPIERTVIQTPDAETTRKPTTAKPGTPAVIQLPDAPTDSETTAGTPVRQRAEPGTPTDLVSMTRSLRNVNLTRSEIVANLARLNNIQNANKIRVGQIIRLFDVNGQPYNYKIGPGDNLWNISKGKLRGQRVEESKKLDKFLNEYQLFLEYENAQDPNAQTTSQQKTGSPEEQAKINQEKQDQRMDITTAKSVASSIKPVLPPSVDTNALAGALVKIDDQNSGKPSKPLTQPEQLAMGPMNALVTKAAVTGQTAPTLSSILRNVANLASKGKA
jgi:hypothetical protein